MAGGSESLEIDVSRRAELTVVVTLAGDLDLASSPELARRLEGLTGNGPRRVVVDLSRVAFVDSSGINVLLAAARALDAAGGRLALAAPTARVRRVLDIVHVADLVAVAVSVEAALAAPGGAAAG